MFLTQDLPDNLSIFRHCFVVTCFDRKKAVICFNLTPFCTVSDTWQNVLLKVTYLNILRYVFYLQNDISKNGAYHFDKNYSSMLVLLAAHT